MTTTDRDQIAALIDGLAWIEKYGVRFFEREDDWGWTVLGTPPTRRILAAINWFAREEGFAADLHEAAPNGLIDFEFEAKVAINVRQCVEDPDQYTWDWAAKEFTAAGPLMTVVTL